MATIDGPSPTNPGEAPRKSPQQVPRITLVIHGSPTGRRLPPEPAAEHVPEPVAEKAPAARRERGGQHEFVDTTWFGRLERLLQSWPITFRLVLLVAVVLTGTAAVAATLGIGGQLALIALSLVERRRRRERVAALRRGTPSVLRAKE